jgi:hypothetical protein
MNTKTFNAKAATLRPSYIPSGNRRAKLADCGMNSLEESHIFNRASKCLLDSYASFTLQDCLNLCAGLDAEAVKKQFQAFTRRSAADGQIKKLKVSCYGCDVWENTFKGQRS